MNNNSGSNMGATGQPQKNNNPSFGNSVPTNNPNFQNINNPQIGSAGSDNNNQASLGAYFNKTSQPIVNQNVTKSVPNIKKRAAWVDMLLFVGEVIVTIILAVVATYFIKQYIIQPFMVEGVSMEPNFHNNEYLIVNELSYRWEKPKRGDVIVFKYPLNEAKDYIKRLIGLPGETVKIKNGQVSVCQKSGQNCEILDESKYLPTGTETDGDVTMILKPDEYFVLGDHRSQSSDSRFWGVLKKDEIIGRVWIKVLPTNEFKIY
jgi:signal peptidase I